jgi:hypothetical protein
MRLSITEDVKIIRKETERSCSVISRIGLQSLLYECLFLPALLLAPRMARHDRSPLNPLLAIPPTEPPPISSPSSPVIPTRRDLNASYSEPDNIQLSPRSLLCWKN